MITLTEKAVSKIKEFADAEGIALSIRVNVAGGGCAGFRNDMMFDEKVNDNDEILNYSGIQIIVDQLSLQYLDGSTIDFIDSVFESGFKFYNDNFKAQCGCGSSYSM